MDRFLRPERFDTTPDSPDAAKSWKHWLRTFNSFLTSVADRNPNKLDLLINYLSPTVYDYVADCPDYDNAIDTLKNLYVKPANEVFARYLLSTAKQEPGQPLDQFVQKLKTLAKDCNCKAVTADENQDALVRDAFISGLASGQIRQRLLERNSLQLKEAFDLARSLEMAEKHSQTYFSNPVAAVADMAQPPVSSDLNTSPSEDYTCAAAQNTTSIGKCFFCGYGRHPRQKCPALNALCKNCGKKGHFAKVCQSKQKSKDGCASTFIPLNLSFVAAAPQSLSNAVVPVKIGNVTVKALIDTGSSESYISLELVSKLGLKQLQSTMEISMASTDHTVKTKGHTFISFQYNSCTYDNIKLSILPGLCAEILLGHDFLRRHKSLEIPFKGSLPTFSVCGLSAANVEAPSLFANLRPDCKPIATKSRRFSQPDKDFIHSEVKRLEAEDIIEQSNSPWRAQVLVTTNDRQKKRLVVDYSQTINIYTELDAYPLPRIDEMVEKISSFEYFTTLDLKSAYHQVKIKDSDKPFTAFEADGNLYQFKRVPFGVTNGVACFQRIMDDIIREENLDDTFAYLDNVTICGRTKAEHDKNLEHFLEIAKKYGLEFNNDKSIFSQRQITLLGYQVSKGVMKPDPERLEPLRKLAPPINTRTQKRAVGLFAYYSSWIPNFSDKIHSLNHNSVFPLPDTVKNDFDTLKLEIEKAAIVTIDHSSPLVVETDASDIAIAATLNQNGRPVAFFSRSLTDSEKKLSSVEKEAYAIVESLRKWRHFLIGKHFRLITDQRSVSFMFDLSLRTKIKNDKIQRWRMELSCFSFECVYRPGGDNAAADTLSRAFCAATPSKSLQEIHDSLCHPGVTRMLHFVKTKNLPYSLDDIKQLTAKCATCCELKPSFYRGQNSPLIKATKPWERLSVDFKGPIPSASSNKYILTVIDEYSRFPFAFPCSDMCSSTVKKCFTELFSTYGLPSFVHSDRGSSFMSSDLQDFLHSRGVATSRTTAFNPKGNGQVERLNGTLWKSIALTLKSEGLPTPQWEKVLPNALHAIRSLLCTATNETPHERFFLFNRKSATGTTLPSWLSSPGRVLMRRNVRNSKYDPLVDEVELLDCNPMYAHVRLQDGRETTVSLHQLAPVGFSHDPNQTVSYESSDSLTIPSHRLPDPSTNAPESPETDPSSQTDTISPHESSLVDTSPPGTDTTPQENSLSKTRSVPFIRNRPYNLRNREA